MSATVSVPCRKPTIVGVNFTEILQLDRAARVLGKMGQVLLGAYSARVVLMLLIVNGRTWLFQRVTVMAELDVPMTCPPKLTLPDVRLTGCTPLPLRATV